MQEFGVEEGEGILERVGLGARDGAFDGRGVEAVRDEARDKKVDCIFEAAGVVAGVREKQAFLGCIGIFINGGRVIAHRKVNFVLRFELGAHFAIEVRGFEEFAQLWRTREDDFMIFGYHALDDD